ncbi:MAG: hypothetical protein AAGJ40_18610 [Planctomycetota bacterium]
MSNPYESLPPDAAAPSSRVRPLGLTVIGVLCLLAGLGGLLVGAVNLIQLIFSAEIAAAVASASDSMSDAQVTMQQESQKVMRQYLVPMLIAQVTMLLMSVGFVVGGVGIFTRRSWVVSWLRRVMGLTVVAELGRGILYLITQLQMMPVMERFGESMAEQTGGNSTMGQMMVIASVFGVVMWLAWAVVKIGCMIWAMGYLKRPLVREYLGLSEV